MSKEMIENSGKAVAKVTMLFLAAILSISMPTSASAQKFNSLVANPFVFCSAPKPCKYCQPWRAIYQEICADQVNSKNTKKYEPSTSTEIVDAVSSGSVQDGATQSVNRVAAGNEGLNLERTVEGLGVLNGPSGARPVEGLQVIK
jgi:hypothetical protein